MKDLAFLKYWMPVIVYAGAIFYASSIPDSPAPSLFTHSDKLFHFLAYAGFAFIILRALDYSKEGLKGQNLRLLAFLLALFYGFTDEFHQYFVPGRDAQLGDILSDGIGAFIGQLFFKIRT